MSHPFKERIEAHPSHRIRSRQEEVDHPVYKEAVFETGEWLMLPPVEPSEAAALIFITFIILKVEIELIASHRTTKLETNGESEWGLVPFTIPLTKSW